MDYINATSVIASGPRKRSWLSCVIGLCLVVIAPATVCAQRRSGSTELRGGVSKTVVLSLSPNASDGGVELNAFESGGALNLVLSGSQFTRNLQVPILIRSNTTYNVKASVQSQTAVLTQLQVLSVDATGRLVASDAVTSFAVKRQFDWRPGGSLVDAEDLSTIDASVPFTIFSGPRISLGGGLASPHNALKVILLLSVQATVAEGSWTLDLKLQGSETSIDQVLLAPPAPHDEPIQLCREQDFSVLQTPKIVGPDSLRSCSQQYRYAARKCSPRATAVRRGYTSPRSPAGRTANKERPKPTPPARG